MEGHVLRGKDRVLWCDRKNVLLSLLGSLLVVV
jgi:hypothetical protein